MRTICYLVIFLLFSLPVFAQKNYFELGLGYVYQKNNLAYDSDHKKIDDYSRPGDGFGSLVPIIRLNYGFDNLYIQSGGIGSKEGAIRLGYNAKSKLNSDVSFYFIYNIPKKVWENPYLLHQNRTHTYLHSYGAGVDINRILGSKFSYSINLIRDNVHNDEIGKMYSRLERDGFRIDQSLSRRFKLSSDTTLNFGIGIERGQYDGSANSYLNYYLRGNLKYDFYSNYSINIFYLLGYAHYDKKHPIFDKTREDITGNILFSIRKDKLLGFENIFGNIYAGMGGSKSNINFYETEALFTGVTLGFLF